MSNEVKDRGMGVLLALFLGMAYGGFILDNEYQKMLLREGITNFTGKGNIVFKDSGKEVELFFYERVEEEKKEVSFNHFIKAVHQVESSGSLTPPDGKKFGEIGPFQVSEPYWIDSRVECAFEDCRDYDTAIKVMTAYFNRYEDKALLNGDYETLARLHNSGPRWREKKHLTNTYWEKIQKHLNN